MIRMRIDPLEIERRIWQRVQGRERLTSGIGIWMRGRSRQRDSKRGFESKFDTCTQGFKETSKETKWEFNTFGNGNNYLERIQGKGLTFGI